MDCYQLIDRQHKKGIFTITKEIEYTILKEFAGSENKATCLETIVGENMHLRGDISSQSDLGEILF